ncbi:hypothetical protein CGRA01v4_11751 [Colletotrichum graminicola]|nr:hypothetical protein CGRA01v4_11751 [Colletotrichum graminicola]
MLPDIKPNPAASYLPRDASHYGASTLSLAILEIDTGLL